MRSVRRLSRPVNGQAHTAWQCHVAKISRRETVGGATLDSARPPLKHRPLTFSNIMGQQLNKHIKRKRRAAYLKRKKERTKAAAKKK